MTDRPNILLITTDQQRFDTIHATGNPHIRTPHLNWLADTGITFDNCYTDCPICMPARATIMTGKHAYNHGQLGNTGQRPIQRETSLPALLTAAGYQTRAQGKMHWEPLRCNYGFEHMEILPDYYRHMAANPHLGYPKDHGVGENEMEPVISTVHDSHSLTHWTVDRSIDFLETRDDSRPFFLWTSFAKPHPPFDPCLNYWQLYQNAPMPEPVEGDWSQDIADIPGFAEATYMLNNSYRFSPELLRDVRRAYYACITQIDYNLGLLFARMREMGLFENTLIIFTSDHGEMLGDHHLGAKSVFFEGSAHVPMFMRPPGSSWDPDPRGGSVCNDLVCLADLMPTCLAAAGVEPPDGLELDGLDILALQAGSAGREVIIGRCGPQMMVREGDLKYVFCERGGAELMFDIAADPYEQRDLLRAGTHEDAAIRLRTHLVDHLGSCGHPAAVDGRLVSTGPASEPEDVRRAEWPGFHYRNFPCDVLH